MVQRFEGADDSYAVSAFIVLANEDTNADPAIAHRKIRSALRRHRLGPYDQKRVDVLRSLRDDLSAEIMKAGRSVYFAKIPQSRFAESADFDFDRLVADFAAKYPTIDSDDLRGIIGYALYFYYLR